MSYEMLPAGELNIEGRKWLKKAKCRIQRGQPYPEFLLIAPGERVRQPDDRDVRTLLYVVCGVIQCVKDGNFAPGHIDFSDKHFTLQISGEVDQIYSDLTRDEAISRASDLAKERAVGAGADPSTLDIVEVEDLPLTYIPGNSLRTRVRVVGDIAR